VAHDTAGSPAPAATLVGGDHDRPPSVERKAVPSLATATQSELVGHDTPLTVFWVMISGADQCGGAALPASVVNCADLPPTATHDVGLPQEIPSSWVSGYPGKGPRLSIRAGPPKIGAVAVALAVAAETSSRSIAIVNTRAVGEIVKT
jgi:hypothetical protein